MGLSKKIRKNLLYKTKERSRTDSISFLKKMNDSVFEGKYFPTFESISFCRFYTSPTWGILTQSKEGKEKKRSEEMQPQRSTQISPNPLLALQNLCENGKEEQPIVMLNLLRFSPLAKYGTAKGLQPPKGVTTGREAFQHYSKLMSPLLQRIGAALVFAAPAKLTMIASRMMAPFGPNPVGFDPSGAIR